MDTVEIARRRFLFMAAGAALVGLTGCSSVNSARNTASGAVATPVQLVSDAIRIAPGDAAAARAAFAGFGSAFLGQMLPDGPVTNAAISPYSLFTVLAMARAGAKGATGQQIDAVLGAAGDAQGAAVAAVDAAVAEALDRASQAPGGTVTVQAANETWVEQGFPVRQEYLDQLAREFGVAARSADFSGDAEGMRLAINAWVAERTNDLIPELFPSDSIRSTTVLVLVNALYLQASWAFPFEPRQDGTFTTADGRAITVPMMSGLPLAASGVKGPGWAAVSLPYVGSGLAMTVLLPDNGLDAVLSGLPEIIDTVATSEPGTTKFDVTLPVFSVRSVPDAAAVVKALGITDLFGDADLSGITEGGLTVDAFVHESVVKVDEEGTEAAAATGMGMAASAPARPEPLVVDRPFVFWIADTTTSAPLFLGVITDPSATA
ncbi:serpin family protein [Nakamurella flava]|nr:serpin family protein [Nakamurella flava]